MPKQRQTTKHAGGRPKKPEPMRPIASLRGKVAFAEWFERLLVHTRLNASTAIEHGLIKLAKDTGFDEPPPSR